MVPLASMVAVSPRKDATFPRMRTVWFVKESRYFALMRGVASDAMFEAQGRMVRWGCKDSCADNTIEGQMERARDTRSRGRFRGPLPRLHNFHPTSPDLVPLVHEMNFNARLAFAAVLLPAWCLCICPILCSSSWSCKLFFVPIRR